MIKQQIKEIVEDALIDSAGGFGVSLEEVADQILALFPQGEGGLLSDEEIKNEALSELAALKAELEEENG